MRPPAPCSALDGRYRIEGLVGVGGMGRVYRACQLGTDREVALKVVSRDEEIPAGRARFRDEAVILARLRHPNIVTLYDFLEADEGDGTVDYLAMELVEGVGLDELLRERKRLPWRMVSAIATQIASALDHAHGRGVVHRDLKPANIVVVDASEDNVRVCVLDFGVAKLVDASRVRNRTRPGLVVGTPAYMSPEQERGEVIPAIDVYALGVLVYETVVGQRPPSGETGPITFGDAELDPAFASLLSRLLDPVADRRPTAFEAAEAFAALARPAQQPAHTRVATRTIALGAVASVVALALSALGGSAVTATSSCPPATAMGVREPRVVEASLSPSAPTPLRTSEGRGGLARAASTGAVAISGAAAVKTASSSEAPAASAKASPPAVAPGYPSARTPVPTTVFSTDGSRLP